MLSVTWNDPPVSPHAISKPIWLTMAPSHGPDRRLQSSAWTLLWPWVTGPSGSLTLQPASRSPDEIFLLWHTAWMLMASFRPSGPSQGLQGTEQDAPCCLAERSRFLKGLPWAQPHPLWDAIKTARHYPGLPQTVPRSSRPSWGGSAASLKLGEDLVHVKWNSKNKKTLSIDIPIIKFRYQVQGAHKQTAIFSRDNETTQINNPHHT